MLTIFSTCKPFLGHTDLIQRNAIQSWTRLQPTPDVIMLGPDEGTREAAEEFGVRHIPDVDRAPSGRMLLSSLHAKAEAASPHDWMCYVNADTILLNDFTEAIQRIARIDRPALVVSSRSGLRLDEPIDFDQPGWGVRLKQRAHPHPAHWRVCDYLAYRRDLYPPMPAFVHGPHPGSEGWLIFTARARGGMVIDATAVVTSIHQDHDAPPVAVSRSAEGEINLKLSGGQERLFFIADATHVLTPAGLRHALEPAYLFRRIYTLPLFRTGLWPLRTVLDGILKISRPLRGRLGWNM